MIHNNDKAGTPYWDDNWSKVEFPKAFDENDQSLDNYVNLQLHAFFKKLFKDKKKFSVLEIGCANSIWPIYFYQERPRFLGYWKSMALKFPRIG
jgi:hypothetical protein